MLKCEVQIESYNSSTEDKSLAWVELERSFSRILESVWRSKDRCEGVFIDSRALLDGNGNTIGHYTVKLGDDDA